MNQSTKQPETTSLPETTQPQKRLCPLTGKMVPWTRPSRTQPNSNHDPITPTSPAKLPQEVRRDNIAQVANKLADMRQEWERIGPVKRSGAAGDKLLKKYRKDALVFWHLTGKHPPSIYEDM